MSGVATAIVASAVIGGVVAHNSAKKQSEAAEAGIAAQEASGQSDRDQQRYFYDKNREDQLAQIAQARTDSEPYRNAGIAALSQLRTDTASGGALDRNYQRGTFEADPGYGFRVQQGEQGIQRAASARGGLYSGATLKALSRFNSGLASQEYGAYDTRENNKENQFNLNRDYHRNNLATLAGVGQTSTRDVTQAGATGTGAIGAAGAAAAGNIGASYTNQGNQIANLMGNAGEARASGYVGIGNALTSGIRGIYNNYQQQQLLNKWNTVPPSSAGGYFNSGGGSNSGGMSEGGVGGYDY